MKPTTVATALLSSGPFANAAITQTCPLTGLCYSLNIPDATAQSGNGDIYFQLQAPTSYSWIALGQGTAMPNSNIFVMYSSADGQNVTLSPRLGTGHVMPQHDTSAEVTLLEGSGISNGMMTANVKCSNCNAWQHGSMDFTSSGASWIYAYKAGEALDSDDLNEGITYHDDSAPFMWSFASAKGGSDVNPFVSATSASNPQGSSNPQASSTPAAVVTQAPVPVVSAAEERNIMIRTAHGYMASTAFLIIFPAGAILIRVASFSGAIWVHAVVQLLAYTIFIAALGMGAYLATTYDELMDAHPIIGIVVFVLMGLQPFTGFTHHYMFKKFASRTVVSWLHLILGRIAVVLGIANGFIGIHWANSAPESDRHAYLALAVIALVLYITSIVYGEYTRAKRLRNVDSESSFPVRGNEKQAVNVDANSL